jgi:hypothetical protein
MSLKASGGRDHMRGDRRKTSMEWPVGVDDRLRLLVRLAEQSGDHRPTSASELLAALICDQPLDGTRLAAVISTYRQNGSGSLTGSVGGEPQQSRRRGRPRRARAAQDSG